MFSGLETCYCASAGDKESHEKESFIDILGMARYAALPEQGLFLTSWWLNKEIFLYHNPIH